MRIPTLLLAFGLTLAACAPEPVVAPTAQSDVRIDGVSILGSWNAIGAPDEPDVDRDLRNGMLTRTLIFNPYNRVRLIGQDRRAGTGQVSFEGRINGTRITFDDLPGTAQVRLRNQRTLELTDPAGNRTVYRRS